MTNKHLGSTFDSWLQQEGLHMDYAKLIDAIKHIVRSLSPHHDDAITAALDGILKSIYANGYEDGQNNPH